MQTRRVTKAQFAEGSGRLNREFRERAAAICVRQTWETGLTTEGRLQRSPQVISRPPEGDECLLDLMGGTMLAISQVTTKLQ